MKRIKGFWKNYQPQIIVVGLLTMMIVAAVLAETLK